MSGQRQKNQCQLTLPLDERGEASVDAAEGTETLRVERETESPAGNQQVTEEGCESLASRRYWTGLSNKRCSRFCKSSGTRHFPNTATVSGPAGQPGKRWHRRSSTSPKDSRRVWIWIWRNSSIVLTMTS